MPKHSDLIAFPKSLGNSSGCRRWRQIRSRLDYRCGGSVGLVDYSTAPNFPFNPTPCGEGSPDGRYRAVQYIDCQGVDTEALSAHNSKMNMSPELAAALAAAEAGARVIRECYQQNLAVTIKSDKSPVTEADIRTEKAIRAVLAERFPEFGFYGEETGHDMRAGAPTWLVDPIDGTKAFVREYPMFSTQIALMREGRLVLGVSSAPLYGELAYAQRGCGAFLNGRRLQVSDIDAVEQAALSAGNLKTLATSGAWPAYGALVSRVSRIRGYGDFLHYHLLAAGKIDAVVESDVNILDIAALVTIVEEAGGRFTTLDGQQISLDSTTVLASNGRIHRAVEEAISFSR